MVAYARRHCSSTRSLGRPQLGSFFGGGGPQIGGSGPFSCIELFSYLSSCICRASLPSDNSILDRAKNNNDVARLLYHLASSAVRIRAAISSRSPDGPRCAAAIKVLRNFIICFEIRAV